MAWYKELAGCSAFIGALEAVKLISDGHGLYDEIIKFDFDLGVPNQLLVVAAIATCFAIVQAFKMLLDPKILVPTLILFTACGLFNLVPWAFGAFGYYARWPAAGIVSVLALFTTFMAFNADSKEVELPLFQWLDEQDRLRIAAVNEANRALRVRIKAQQSPRSSHFARENLRYTA